MNRPGRHALALVAGLALAAPAASAQPADDSDGVIVVNGGASTDELAKLRKRIEALGVLQPTSAAVSAALENEPPYDLDPIKNAYANFEFDRADELGMPCVINLSVGYHNPANAWDASVYIFNLMDQEINDPGTRDARGDYYSPMRPEARMTIWAKLTYKI